MATARPFAYNPSQTNIPGVSLFGYLSVGGIGTGKIAGLTTWNGPNEDLGYVIAKVVPGNTQPTPIVGVSASVAFYRSATFSEAAFLNIVNKGLHLNYSVGTDASFYLLNNGYWTNYPSVTYDADALIYMNALTATGVVLDSNTKGYIDTLFISLKTNGLYTKMDAFYPMLGNTVNSQKLNGKSVAGVRQSTYDLGFGGGWIFIQGGIGIAGIAKGNATNTYIATNKQYSDLPSLLNTHFAVYGNDAGGYGGYDTGAADVYVGDQYTTTGVSYRFVEMRLAYSPQNLSYGYVNNQRDYNSTYDYPENILAGNGPTPNNNGISTHNSFAVMSYDNDLLNGTNNFSINGIPYSNYGTSPSDPATTPYGADLLFGYYYDWFNGFQMYTGGAYAWLGFGTYLSTVDQYNYQSIVNTFMYSFGKNTY